MSVCTAALSFACLSVRAQAPIYGEAIPSFDALEAAGAVIGEVRIKPQDIFDEDDPEENNALFRLANRLHINTRPVVIRRVLLFGSGDKVSRRVIEESERLLRASHYLYDVSIQPTAYRDGVVDIEVRTRDTWSFEPGASFSRGGGSNSGGASVKEKNLLGTGVTLGVSQSSTVDRKGREVEIAHHQVFGGRTSVVYKQSDLSDGSSKEFSLTRPFYAFDARWAAGASAAQFDRADSVYSNGAIVHQFRHKQQSGEVFGGWSKGLVDGWTQRYSVGVGYLDDKYRPEPGAVAPAQLPNDQTLIYPFVLYEVLEDGYQKVKNRDKVQRPEYFNLGFTSRIQLGRAAMGLGSTRDLWLYSGTFSKGTRLAPSADLLGNLNFSGQYAASGGERQALGLSLRYYWQQSNRAVFYAAASGNRLTNPLPTDQLLLGGDNGLRGYPLRYQSGNQRALFTVEERIYTDWYPFRLIRVGGAVYFDVGRAWGGPNQNIANPGWLRDIGIGLRIVSDRSASANVLHIDLAFPIDPDVNIKKVQFLVKGHSTF